MLRDAPAVMLWRRVASLDEARSMAGELFQWPVVGEDRYSVLFDAGSAMVGYWTQNEPLEEATLTFASGGSCSLENLSRYDLVVNPAVEMVVASPRLSKNVDYLSALHGTTPSLLRSAQGESVRFFDESGNLNTLLQPGDGPEGQALARQQRRGGETKEGPRTGGGGAGMVEYRLSVSNLGRSRQFYGGILQLEEREGAGGGEFRFSAGGITISLRPETRLGMVRALRKTQRLTADWLVFHTPDLERTVEGLSAQGVTIPKGIEESDIGQIAYFEDPDGYALVAWRPSGSVTPQQPINFYPVLERIVGRR